LKGSLKGFYFGLIKVIIHQPYMPAINGEVAFGDEYLARKTGQLVVKKLQNNQSTSITRDELNSLLKTEITYFTCH
jgi:hypothetical protein